MEERPGMRRLLQRSLQRLPAADDNQQEALQTSIEGAVSDWLGSPPVEPDVDPLQWWADATAQGAAKPSESAAVRFLAPLARKYLAVPGSNGSIERVWSSGRRTLVFNRQSLSGTHVEAF